MDFRFTEEQQLLRDRDEETKSVEKDSMVDVTPKKDESKASS